MIMYAAATGNAITAVFQCLSVISVKGFLTLSLQYQRLEDFLKKKNNPALLPIQIAYYTGLRIGEVCGLTWQDINLEEQYLTVRRSMRYNGARHRTEIGATKRKKIRTVDFCDTLAAILKTAKICKKHTFTIDKCVISVYNISMKEEN